MVVSKHYKTLFNHKRRIMENVRTLYYWLEHSQWTFDGYLTQRNVRVFQHPSWARLPQYMRSYVNGYMDCMYHRFEKEHLVWCLQWQGENITSKEWEALFPEQDNRPPWKNAGTLPWGFCYADSRKPYDDMRIPDEERKA